MSALKDWYMVFNVDSNEFGLAPLALSSDEFVRSIPEAGPRVINDKTIEDYQGELRGINPAPNVAIIGAILSVIGVTTLTILFFVIWQTVYMYRPSTR